MLRTPTPFLIVAAIAFASFTGIVHTASAASPNEAFAQQKEIVVYRLTSARTMHLENSATAQQYQAALKQLGCETQLEVHQGHFDLTYRCPQWESAQFESHAAAHKWHAWLASLGFEVTHRHE